MTFIQDLRQKHWFILMMDELRSYEHLSSLFFIILSIVITLYVFFTSKALQLLVLVMAKSSNYVTYYHLISVFVLGALLPFVCLMLFHDSVYRDLDDERIRMIITKVSRTEYIISKLLSRMVVLLISLLVICIFISAYSYYKMNHFFIGHTIFLLCSYGLMCTFVSTFYLLISTSSQNPLFAGSLVPFVSFILLMFPKTKGLSFYTHAVVNEFGLMHFMFFIIGSIILLMTCIYIFKRKKL